MPSCAKLSFFRAKLCNLCDFEVGICQVVIEKAGVYQPCYWSHVQRVGTVNGLNGGTEEEKTFLSHFIDLRSCAEMGCCIREHVYACACGVRVWELEHKAREKKTYHHFSLAVSSSAERSQ